LPGNGLDHNGVRALVRASDPRAAPLRTNVEDDRRAGARRPAPAGLLGAQIARLLAHFALVALLVLLVGRSIGLLRRVSLTRRALRIHRCGGEGQRERCDHRQRSVAKFHDFSPYRSYRKVRHEPVRTELGRRWLP
jgi:hypothetical protein